MNTLNAGLAKANITPRVGVELCGFGPYLCRHSIGIRDPLWARAMALELGDSRLILVSCDLIGIPLAMTRKVRELVHERTGIPPHAIMIACSHTHSGPNVRCYAGWGEPDPTYVARLPYRIAQACVSAFSNRREAQLAHAEVPCEQIGVNREYDEDAQPLDRVLKDDWHPAKPELTDSTCHVLTIRAGSRLLGFVSYFGCHPVVCCQKNHHIHGDYCGVATNLVEQDHPGSVGLFLQGANGDVNSCVVHKEEKESLEALDIIAARYSRSLRDGITKARGIDPDVLAGVVEQKAFSRKEWPIEALRGKLAEQEAILCTVDDGPTVGDETHAVRMSMVNVHALRKIIRKMETGESLALPTQVHGLRVGPITIVGSGFETFQAIKNDVVRSAHGPITWVCSFLNDSVGYAPDRTAAARGGYAADVAPMILGTMPYTNTHDELVAALLSIDKALH